MAGMDAGYTGEVLKPGFMRDRLVLGSTDTYLKNWSIELRVTGAILEGKTLETVLSMPKAYTYRCFPGV